MYYTIDVLTVVNCFYTFRLYLAALHYNENSDRLQAVDQDGRPRYDLRFPKYKKGGQVVRVVKTKSTIGEFIEASETYSGPCNLRPLYLTIAPILRHLSVTPI